MCLRPELPVRGVIIFMRKSYRSVTGSFLHGGRGDPPAPSDRCGRRACGGAGARTAEPPPARRTPGRAWRAPRGAGARRSRRPGWRGPSPGRHALGAAPFLHGRADDVPPPVAVAHPEASQVAARLGADLRMSLRGMSIARCDPTLSRGHPRRAGPPGSRVRAVSRRRSRRTSGRTASRAAPGRCHVKFRFPGAPARRPRSCQASTPG